MPRSRLTTRVASASPSMSSATISSGRLRLRDLLEQRHEYSRTELIFSSCIEDVGVLELALHLFSVPSAKWGAEVALVELHALDPLDLGLEGLAALDRDDTPSLPTRSMASAILSPISVSLLAAMVAT